MTRNRRNGSKLTKQRLEEVHNQPIDLGPKLQDSDGNLVEAASCSNNPELTHIRATVVDQRPVFMQCIVEFIENDNRLARHQGVHGRKAVQSRGIKIAVVMYNQTVL